jgi:transcriptional regulator with XRE-family HTH domain
MWLDTLVKVVGKAELTNSDLARMLGTSSQYCSKLLSGDSSPPSAGKILKLLNFLETESLLSEHEALEFLHDVIRDKLGTSELILLNEYERRVKSLMIQDDDFLNTFHRVYANNMVVSQDSVRILQALQHLPKTHHRYILQFIDIALNKESLVLEKLIEFLEADS